MDIDVQTAMLFLFFIFCTRDLLAFQTSNKQTNKKRGTVRKIKKEPKIRTKFKPLKSLQ